MINYHCFEVLEIDTLFVPETNWVDATWHKLFGEFKASSAQLEWQRLQHEHVLSIHCRRLKYTCLNRLLILIEHLFLLLEW